MRTTLDLPDELLKQAKIEAVERGTTLRELVGTALAKELRQETASRTRRTRFPIFRSTRPGALRLSQRKISRAEAQEEARRLGPAR